jgi:hypothetical protein
MQYITISNGQTFLDVAMQYAGSTEAAFAISVKNDLPITDELEAGSVIPKPDIINASVAQLFSVEKIKPRSILNNAEGDNEGIEHWYLEDDFIVQ